ncbi:hypothetical protein BKA56DRAFT_615324 [Ilyonectria sp. MPI-CAGE-AT-0026]|nr:hypothetical protein BKA56DRAFT_615324 [Ilyonectria sp. MPI-CAGE-AT-0026]
MCFRVSCLLSLICCLLVLILGPSFRIRLLLAYIVPVSTADATHVPASINHPRWGLHMIRPDNSLSCSLVPGYLLVVRLYQGLILTLSSFGFRLRDMEGLAWTKSLMFKHAK